MAKSIEYGVSTPQSDFDRRVNDNNAPGSNAVKRSGKKMKEQGMAPGKQTKGFGVGRS